MSRRIAARVALLAVLAICCAASPAWAHPGHGADPTVPHTPAPTSASDGGGGTSPLLIVAVVVGLLALGGGLAYVKQKQSGAAG